MEISRRKFISLLGSSAAGAVLFQACGVPEAELLVQAPLEMPEDLVAGYDIQYATLCTQCPTSEGIVVRVMAGRAKKIEGNIDYPINRGKHSARCEAAIQDLYHPDRITTPMLKNRDTGIWNEISWPEAMSRLEAGFKEAQKLQPIMVTPPLNGHLANVVGRFMSALDGQHITYEPMEQTNLRRAMQETYQQELLPDFDIKNASYILSFGADFLNTWGSPVRYSWQYGQFRQGDRPRGTLVHVDSRFSMTGANADDWVFINPGWEGHLALSIAQVMISEGMCDPNAANAITGGDLTKLNRYSPEIISDHVGIKADRIRHIATEFASHRPSLAIGGGSTAAHTNGLFNLNAIYCLNYLVQGLGDQGGIVFNPKPALDDLPNAPTTSSFKDWTRLIEDMDNDRIGALIFKGADPVYGVPTSAGLRNVLSKVPFIVSFAGHMNDTASSADLVLPEHSTLEDWGTDVPDPGPGYQTIGFQQPVVRPFLETNGSNIGSRSFPDVLLEIGRSLDIDLGLPGETYRDLLEESASRLYEQGRGSVRASNFRSFWNGLLQRGGWWDTKATYDGPTPTPPTVASSPSEPRFSGGSFEFALIPFSSTSLTDGKGAHLPWLQATPDPISTATWRTWVEINATVAKNRNIEEGDVVRITSPAGSIEALAYPHPGISPTVVSVPTGQGHISKDRYSEKRGANIFSILSSELVDEQTGALAWAATRVNIEKTGEWERLPKFENVAPDLATDDDHHIIQLTSEDH